MAVEESAGQLARRLARPAGLTEREDGDAVRDGAWLLAWGELPIGRPAVRP
jgi:hypothetical protein